MSNPLEIRINYTNALNQAKALDNIAARLRDAANRDFQDAMSAIGAAWKSDSAPDYLKKGQKVREDMCKTAKNLGDIAEAIRKIAQRIYNAEMEAWRIAHERTFF